MNFVVGQREVMVDTYEGFAERYDWMKQENPVRQEFFRQLFARHKVARVLDCTCGGILDLVLSLEGRGEMLPSLLRERATGGIYSVRGMMDPA